MGHEPWKINHIDSLGNRNDPTYIVLRKLIGAYQKGVLKNDLRGEI